LDDLIIVRLGLHWLYGSHHQQVIAPQKLKSRERRRKKPVNYYTAAAVILSSFLALFSVTPTTMATNIFSENYWNEINFPLLRVHTSIFNDV